MVKKRTPSDDASESSARQRLECCSPPDGLYYFCNAYVDDGNKDVCLRRNAHYARPMVSIKKLSVYRTNTLLKAVSIHPSTPTPHPLSSRRQCSLLARARARTHAPHKTGDDPFGSQSQHRVAFLSSFQHAALSNALFPSLIDEFVTEASGGVLPKGRSAFSRTAATLACSVQSYSAEENG